MTDFELAQELFDDPDISERFLLREILKSSLRQEQILMTAKEIIDKLTTDFGTMSTRVGQQLDTLKQQMADLQAQIANGQVTPEVQTAADTLDQSINNFQVPQPPDVPAPDQPPTNP